MLSGLLYGRIPIIATATTIREIMIMCAGDVYRMVSVRVFLLFFMEIHSIMSTSALSTHIAAI